MLITPSTLKVLNTTFSKLFQDGFTATEPWYRQFVTVVPSSTEQNDYGWMADDLELREWVGERVVRNLSAHSYAIKNKEFELTVGVPRPKIMDDQLGIYNHRFTTMGRATAKHPDKLLLGLMQGNNLAYDGQDFWDTDHPVNLMDSSLGTQSNYEASGFALTVDNYAEARTRMMAYLGESGRPLGIMPNTLVVPPQLEKVGRQILQAEFIQGSAAAISNVYRNSANLVVIPELATQATTWYLFDLSPGLQPFIHQARLAPEFVAKIDPNDDGVFWQNAYHWGVYARYNAGFGLWFKAFKAAA